MMFPGMPDQGKTRVGQEDSPTREEAPPLPEDVSDDALLDGRVRLLQPRAGYRVAIDPVVLAAAMAPRRGARVLDVGMGVGAATLCLAHRVADVTVVGIELQEGLVALAKRNAALNGLGDRVDVLHGDIADPPGRLVPGSFDHVMMNPPYMARDHGHPPPDPARAAAHVEAGADLTGWIDFALRMARRKGDVTLVHRADRLDHILAAFYGRAGAITVLPVRAHRARRAKRVIVRARKGVSGPLQLLGALVVHDEQGGYTPPARGILRDGLALNFRDFY